MKKLYDEIMAIETPGFGDEYDNGFADGLDECAELAKKYDEEIEILKNKIEELEGHIREVNFYKK